MKMFESVSGNTAFRRYERKPIIDGASLFEYLEKSALFEFDSNVLIVRKICLIICRLFIQSAEAHEAEKHNSPAILTEPIGYVHRFKAITY